MAWSRAAAVAGGKASAAKRHRKLKQLGLVHAGGNVYVARKTVAQDLKATRTAFRELHQFTMSGRGKTEKASLGAVLAHHKAAGELFASTGHKAIGTGRYQYTRTGGHKRSQTKRVIISLKPQTLATGKKHLANRQKYLGKGK